MMGKISLDDVLSESYGCAAWRTRPCDLASAIGKFGKAEVEWSADLLIKFFKKKEYWAGFLLSELMEFAESEGENKDTILVGLIGYWVNNPNLPLGSVCGPAPYLVVNEIGSIHVTRYFIEKITGRPID